MCGRFSATFTFREIKLRWNLQNELSFQPRYNIAPSQSVPVIVRNGNRCEARLMKWGLVPWTAADARGGHRMINARAETLLEKAVFRSLLSRRRCLIPADGFYEWRREGREKVPLWIHAKNREPFVFAGLWDSWRDAKRGEPLETFTIVTTEANQLLRAIHHRMPVIYDEPQSRRWLDPGGGTSGTELSAVLAPWPAERMAVHEVSNLVNTPAHDRPECIEPLPTGYARPGQLPLI
jgi:putative SOS response-associated peptidase YedK